MGYHLEGVYKEEGILHLSSVYYNGLPEDNGNPKYIYIYITMYDTILYYHSINIGI